METILIWFGSGFAFSVGVFSGAILMSLARRKYANQDDNHAELASLLRERNTWSSLQATHLESIARVANMMVQQGK